MDKCAVTNKLWRAILSSFEIVLLLGCWCSWVHTHRTNHTHYSGVHVCSPRIKPSHSRGQPKHVVFVYAHHIITAASKATQGDV